MKHVLLLFAVFFFGYAKAQTFDMQPPSNLIVITIDGIRWQEIFQGANEAILNDGRYVNDTSHTATAFWDDDIEKRRKLLTPFLWNVVASNGIMYGNRTYGNKMDVTNNYKFSYPGYNELFTGYPDSKFVPNTPVLNNNTNVFEFLNKQDGYQNNVAVFSSWNIFPFILNEERSKIPVNSGYEPIIEDDSEAIAINKIQRTYPKEEHTRLDRLTYLSARKYIEAHHPKVMLLSFGEADELAHHQHYDSYLQSIHETDEMMAALWQYLQNDPFYRNNTTLIITTDHGRGFKTNTWCDHLFFIKGSKEIWMAAMGPTIEPLGEMKNQQTIYQKQMAATIAHLLGFTFTSEHNIGACLNLPLKIDSKQSVDTKPVMALHN